MWEYGPMEPEWHPVALKCVASGSNSIRYQSSRLRTATMDTLWQLNIAIENDHSLFTHFG